MKTGPLHNSHCAVVPVFFRPNFAAAEALGVETQWVDQAHISEQVTASAETLALADCDGIIICNSASAEMGSVIKTCDENEVYVAQFFRVINKETNPDEYAQACASPLLCRRRA